MKSLLLILAILSYTYHAKGVYVFSGNPYSIGSLTVKHLVITKTFDGSPEHMSVYFPVQSGSYVPLLFISGLYGFLYSEMYSTVLTQLATHGYIVAGIDLGYPADDISARQGILNHSISDEAQRIDSAIKWLRANLNQNTLVISGNGDVKANWTLLGSFTHSAGADNIYKFIKANATVLKAVAFLEPISFNFTSPLNYSIPTLSYGTQLSEEFPDCILPKYDFRHFYKMLKCPRIEMNVTAYGHCDILDEDFWEVCHLSHFCKTNEENDRVFYRTFVTGVLSSFFGTYVQENRGLLQYITEINKVPVTLGNLQTDLC